MITFAHCLDGMSSGSTFVSLHVEPTMFVNLTPAQDPVCTRVNTHRIKSLFQMVYAFLDLRSSECTCAQQVLVLFQESFNATTISLQ